jgi:death on curing protein
MTDFLETDFLETDDLVSIARQVVGRDLHVGDWGLLASAAARPKATVFGEDAYPDLDGKAAALMSSLVRNHALVDGNKRLGWAATVVFCELNGMDLAPPSEDEAYDLVIGVADGSQVDVAKISEHLRRWTRPLT